MEQVLHSLVLEMDQTSDGSLYSPKDYSPASPDFGSPQFPDSPQDAPAAKKPHVEERHWQSSKIRFPIKMREEIEGGLDPNTRWEESEVMEVPMYGGCCIYPDIGFSEAWVRRNTPLHNAVWYRDFELAEFLLAAGADPNLHNALGNTPLHQAIFDYLDPKPEGIPFWIKHGADLDATTLEAHVRWGWEGKKSNVGGCTPLIAAMATSQISTMKLLLDHGANPNWKSPDGWKILDLALLSDDRRAMGLLISFGAEFSVSPTNIPASLQDAKNAARELLAVATSNLVFPPRELQEIYYYALAGTTSLQLKEALSAESSQRRAEEVIDQFYSSLRAIAEIERDLASESFCRQCSDFQAQAQFSHQGYPAEDKEFEFQLFDNRSQLETSAMNGCPLCSLVADVLDAREKMLQTMKTDEKATSSVENHDHPILLKTTFYWATFYNLGTIDVFLGGKRQWCAELLSVDENAKPIVTIKQKKGTGEAFDDAMDIAKDWLESCDTSHSHLACQKFSQELRGNKKKAYPTRLVALGDGKSPPFLVEGVDDSMPYVALSYPKGNGDLALRTLDANLKERKQRIATANLPDLFQDAMKTARKLGFAYIWIDELCIIQDNEEDRRNEMSKMDWIYLGAEVTISSLVAESVSDRLMLPRPFRSALPVPIKMWRAKGSRPDWKAGEVQTTVISRPWLRVQRGKLEKPADLPAHSLQEELLSSRVLYFGRELMYWACPCIQIAEANPTKPVQENAERGDLWKHMLVKRAMRGISADARHSGYDHKHPELISAWQKEIEAYSSRKLARPEDRLASIWGLSRFMAAQSQNEFVGGVWWGDKLAESLSWRPKKPLSGQARSPSWSWVSIPGEVSYDQIDKTCRPDGSVALAAPVSHQIQSHHPTSSNLSGSTITIKGSLYSKQTLEEYGSKSRTFNSPPKYVFDYEDGGIGCENLYIFDLLGFKRGPLPSGWGLPAYPFGRAPGKLFMLLDSTGLSPGQFRRVGLGILEMSGSYHVPVNDMWISDEKEFNDTITLV